MDKPSTPTSNAGAPHPTAAGLTMQLVVPVDRLGLPASGEGGSHQYGYTAGRLTTDTWTYNGNVFVKTYTYTNGVISGESEWVQQ